MIIFEVITVQKETNTVLFYTPLLSQPANVIFKYFSLKDNPYHQLLCTNFIKRSPLNSAVTNKYNASAQQKQIFTNWNWLLTYCERECNGEIKVIIHL